MNIFPVPDRPHVRGERAAETVQITRIPGVGRAPAARDGRCARSDRGCVPPGQVRACSTRPRGVCGVGRSFHSPHAVSVGAAPSVRWRFRPTTAGRVCVRAGEAAAAGVRLPRVPYDGGPRGQSCMSDGQWPAGADGCRLEGVGRPSRWGPVSWPLGRLVRPVAAGTAAARRHGACGPPPVAEDDRTCRRRGERASTGRRCTLLPVKARSSNARQERRTAGGRRPYYWPPLLRAPALLIRSLGVGRGERRLYYSSHWPGPRPTRGMCGTIVCTSTIVGSRGGDGDHIYQVAAAADGANRFVASPQIAVASRWE